MKKTFIMPFLLAITLLFSCGGKGSESSDVVSKSSSASSSQPPIQSSTGSSSAVTPKPELHGFAVYAKVPTSWSKPNLWAWQDGGDGINAYPSIAWPGRAMIADSANDGWYYLTVPSYVNMVIINANQGGTDGVQTDGVKINSANVWFSDFVESEVPATSSAPASKKYTVTPAYTKATIGDVKSYEPVNYAYAYVPNDWKTAKLYGEKGNKDPEELTIALQTDGWFDGLVSYNYDSFYLTNGGTGTAFKKSASITVKSDIGVNPYYLVVADEKDTAGTYKISIQYTKPTINVKTYLMHASVPSSWTEPHLWAWNNASGTGAFTTWPGEKLVKNGDYFDYDIPTFCDAIIINDGGVQNGVKSDTVVQTTDLKDVEAKECWITIGAVDSEGKYVSSVSYAKPE